MDEKVEKKHRGRDDRVEDITSKEHDVSGGSFLEGQTSFVDNSAFHGMDMETAHDH